MSDRQQKERNRDLINAITGGSVDDIQHAIDRGAELSATDRLGRSVLAIATTQGEPGSVDLFIRLGADVNAHHGKHGYTPLHSAVGCGNLEACRSLLAAGANVGALEVDGLTPLHKVAHAPRNRHDLVDLLVANGADIHANDEHGNTPLHNAARHSNGEVAQALIAHGADMEARNHKGKAPRDVFAKFLPAQGTLDAASVFQAYDRQQALQQIAKPRGLDLADPEELAERRGRFM